MAKLKAPLMSLGASGAIGKALVYFGWKGLDVVREYVVPANPKTTGQTTQRGYLTQAVESIHGAQAWAAHLLDETDIMAYALLGSTYATPRTWFNQAIKIIVDQLVASKHPILYSDGSTTPGATQLAVSITQVSAYATAGNFHYGTSKTALLNTIAGTLAAQTWSKTITGLTKGIKYYWQFKPTVPAASIGGVSGIYYGTPT